MQRLTVRPLLVGELLGRRRQLAEPVRQDGLGRHRLGDDAMSSGSAEELDDAVRAASWYRIGLAAAATSGAARLRRVVEFELLDEFELELFEELELELLDELELELLDELELELLDEFELELLDEFELVFPIRRAAARSSAAVSPASSGPASSARRSWWWAAASSLLSAPPSSSCWWSSTCWSASA